MVYKRYTEDTSDNRLALRRHRGFWMALAGGAVAAIVLGVVLTRALRPSAVETEPERTAAGNAPATAATPEPAASASLAPLSSPSPIRSPLMRPTPRTSPSESAASPAEPGRFTNADLERMKREGGALPLPPTPRASPSPSRPAASPPASPAAKASPSPVARTSPSPAGSPPVRPASPRPSARASGEPAVVQPGESGSESEEAVWRARTQRRMAAVRAAEDRLRRAQESVSRLREQTTAALAEGADRATALQQQLQQAEDRLDQAGRDLQRAEEALDRLDDEARRAGVPLDWVRHQ
jgi:hypothetical protein